MISRENQICFIVLFLIVFELSLAVAEEASPRHTVDTLLSSIGNLKTDEQLSPKELETNKNLSHRALALLDLQEVSRKALGKYWKKRTSGEKKRFVDLLGQMFIKEAFPSSGKFFSMLKLVYGKTIIKKSKASVPLIAIHEKEGEIDIDFYLHKSRGQWQVVDIDLDEISMGNNLRSQFYKILSKNDYKELIRRMEEKLTKIKG